MRPSCLLYSCVCLCGSNMVRRGGQHQWLLATNKPQNIGAEPSTARRTEVQRKKDHGREGFHATGCARSCRSLIGDYADFPLGWPKEASSKQAEGMWAAKLSCYGTAARSGRESLPRAAAAGQTGCLCLCILAKATETTSGIGGWAGRRVQTSSCMRTAGSG